MKQIFKDILGYLITGILSVAFSALMFAMTVKREDDKEINSKINQLSTTKADISDVIERDLKITKDLDDHKKTDEQMRNLILNSLKDIKDQTSEVKKTQDIILSKLMK